MLCQLQNLENLNINQARGKNYRKVVIFLQEISICTPLKLLSRIMELDDPQ